MLCRTRSKVASHQGSAASCPHSSQAPLCSSDTRHTPPRGRTPGASVAPRTDSGGGSRTAWRQASAQGPHTLAQLGSRRHQPLSLVTHEVRRTYRVVHVVVDATKVDLSGRWRDYVNGPVGLNRGSPRVYGLYARRGARAAVVSAGWGRAGGVDPSREAGWRERGQASSRGGDRRRGCGSWETHLEGGVAETWRRDGSRAAGCGSRRPGRRRRLGRDR